MNIVSDETGQNLVEFALVIPIFILILMGMIDFGWYLKQNHDLTRANAQGARVAAFSATDTTIKDTVINSAPDNLSLGAENVSIERQDFDMTRGTSVQVSTTASYTSLTGFSPVHMLLNNKELNAETTIRIE